MASTSRGKKRKYEDISDVDISTITKNKDCTFNVRGVFEDEVNWLTGKGTPGRMKIVDGKIYFQGRNGSCWAWGSAKLSEAAIRRAGKTVRTLSVQNFLDTVYRPGLTKEGHIQAGLQWAKLQGVMTKEEYEIGDRIYSGNQPIEQTPIQPNGERHFIDNWYPLNDDEETILAALRQTVLCVSVRCFSAFLKLYGRGLLDLDEAEANHDHEVAIDHGGRNPIGHTVLLVAAGKFTPFSPRLKHLTMNYWMVKNQWELDWGYENLGYLLRHSSLLKIHANEADLSEADLRKLSERLRPNFFPHYAIVDGAELCMDTYASNVLKGGFTIAELVEWITGKYRWRRLLYLFYKPSACQVDADELFTAVGKTYHLEPKVILALINLELEDYKRSFESFGFGENEDLVLLLYQPQQPHRRGQRFIHRKPSSAKKFTGNFTFGEILHWLGHVVNAGPPPS